MDIEKKAYERTQITFIGNCFERICCDLRLKGMIKCSEREKVNIINCDCNALIKFAEAIKNEIIELLAGVVCPHKICKFSNGCAGREEGRNEGFSCNLIILFDTKERKENKNIVAVNPSQLPLFKSAW